MTRDPRHDILFEPVQIGPVTAPNRFYQVPHCTGMGWLRPRMLAEMRGIKAEGGWGVVCTEYCSIHPSSDDLPHPYASMWDERDVKAHALMTERVHAHGSLAGVELWYGGASSANLDTREHAMDLASVPNLAGNPYQTRAMDKADIRQLRQWHRDAAVRAKEAGFDIVYVYATHGYLLSRFLSPTANTRTDEYGGSLENRVRLVRELIEETKEAVGDTCAVAVRFCADERIGDDGQPVTGERRDMLEHLAELPDLWDINIADYSYEMGTSRFVKEGALEPYMSFVKSVTSKPVVTVGRFTSPDTMASQVRRGITDLIGAARPSIADPFLPNKIAEGRLEDIRECIGCNICYTGDAKSVPFRCTQNPAIGEEWRRGWHPEKIGATGPGSKVLIVGAGPAGLEAARVLGSRGYEVMLAEATRDLGGRVTREARLPGLSEWIRVRDYRVQQIEKLPTVSVYRESAMTAQDILDVGADHVALATGAKWRRDLFDGAVYRSVHQPESGCRILTPDDLMDGEMPQGPVLIFDNDHYYMASVLAEKLTLNGAEVSLATPAKILSPWSVNTAEHDRIQVRMIKLGVRVLTARELKRYDKKAVTLKCGYSGQEQTLDTGTVVIVGHRAPNDGLYHELRDILDRSANDKRLSITRIGDCLAPGIIASSVYAGHQYGRSLDTDDGIAGSPRYDRVLFE